MTSPSDHDELSNLPWREPCGPRAEVSEAIRKQCTRGICAQRSLSATQRLGLSLLLIFAVVTILALLSASADQPEGALRSALFGAAGWGVVMAAVLLVGLARPPGRRVSRTARLVLAVSVPILFLAYLSFAASGSLPLGAFLQEGEATHALACGLHALTFGAIVAGGMLFIWRGTDPVTPGISGALAGLVGGLTGAVAIGSACPTGSTWHLWLGHGLTVLLLIGVGWLAGRRWLSP
jgi:hypothetical protein